MEPSSRKWVVAFAVLVIVAVQFLVYRPVLNNEFLNYDDDAYVYENPNIKKLDAESVAWIFAKPYYRSYTPLTFVSHAVDYKLWGKNPWGHHLGNLLLHTVNSVFVFLFGLMLLQAAQRRYGADNPGLSPEPRSVPDNATLVSAFLAAVLFSMHPMRVESVSWVSDRKDLLLAFFVLPCCMTYFKYEASRGTRHAIRWYLASLFLFVLALAAKSIAVVVPLLLMLVDILLLGKGVGKGGWKAIALEKVPFLLLSAGFGAIALGAVGKSQLPHIITKLSAFQRVLLPFYSIMFYPAKILWPFHLTPEYDAVDSSVMFLATICFAVVTWAAIRAARRGNPWWLLGWGCYILLIVPTVTGGGAGIQPWADRYSYLPSVSLMLLIGGGLLWAWRWCERKGMPARVAFGVVGILLAFGCIMLTAEQIPIWQNGLALWQHAVREAPDLPMPYANLGVVLDGKGDPDGALAEYKKALALVPWYADALYNSGISFESKGMLDSAEIYYQKTIAADTLYDDACVNLGNLYVRAGKLDDGIAQFRRAIAINSSDPDPYYNMGIAYYSEGEIEKALDCFQDALKRSPGYAKAFHNIAVIYLQFGATEPAMECFRKAARLGLAEAQGVLKAKGSTW
jgi:protein O-mannosyl-transferase